MQAFDGPECTPAIWRAHIVVENARAEYGPGSIVEIAVLIQIPVPVGLQEVAVAQGCITIGTDI